MEQNIEAGDFFDNNPIERVSQRFQMIFCEESEHLKFETELREYIGRLRREPNPPVIVLPATDWRKEPAVEYRH